MWICTNKAFLSIVQHDEDPSLLLVRARLKTHIEAVFPGAVIGYTPDADYAYRAVLPREVVTCMLIRQVQQIDYRNFKQSVKNRVLHDAYTRVWHIMSTLQRRFTRL